MLGEESMKESFLDASGRRLSCTLVTGLMVHGAQSQGHVTCNVGVRVL